jgi:beta-lactamase superfamily II metal-dependent hydrolase
VCWKAFLLFPGDAQWGVWREILADTDARALLERATLYKVSHHGSHNGSPKSLVHDVLPDHVTSMMSFRTMERWTGIPQTDLVAALRTPGRTLLRPDEDIPAAVPGGVGAVRRAPDGLWTEIDLG